MRRVEGGGNLQLSPSPKLVIFRRRHFAGREDGLMASCLQAQRDGNVGVEPNEPTVELVPKLGKLSTRQVADAGFRLFDLAHG